jgi:mono/diheme cytochrome c family protein
MTAPATPPRLPRLALCCLATLLALTPRPARAAGAGAGAPEAGEKLAAQTLAIFGEKCFGCHTASAKPKFKKFNYVDDLAKLASNPKFIIPGDPSKSELYQEVLKEEMPPDDSDVAPLSPAQKETIRAWIAAGAPAGRTLPPRIQGGGFTPSGSDRSIRRDPGTPNPGQSTAPNPKRPERPFLTRLIIWLGKFHPLAAHTPIAVLMAAAIAEMLFMKYRAPALTGAARFCSVLGCLGAIATAALGWAMASNHTSSDLLESHRWAGTAAAIISIPVALLGEWGARRALRENRDWHGASRWAFRLGVFFIAGFVGFAAHLGGLIHWGEDFFKFPS